MTLQVFVDDSGNQPGDRVFVLGGFISTAERWDKFSLEWDAACAEDPATPDFHMAKAWRLKGGYWRGESEDERIAMRDKKLAKLATIIRDNVICSITTGLTWRAYENAARGKVPPIMDTPYFFLFWRVIQLVAKWERECGLREKVEVVFDDQSKIGLEALSWHYAFLHCMDDDEKIMLSGMPIFKHDSEALPLKAADMWAWHYRREVANRERHGESFKRTEAGDILWQPTYVCSPMVEHDLRSLAARLSAA